MDINSIIQGVGKEQGFTEQQAQQAKEQYFRYFMIDFIEYNLRKVVSDNTVYCAKKCNMFDNLEKENVDENQELSCFEKCIGKFSDSYESALDVFGNHLRTMNKSKVFTHSKTQEEKQQLERKFLMGEGTDDPIYDKPQLRKKNNL